MKDGRNSYFIFLVFSRENNPQIALHLVYLSKTEFDNSNAKNYLFLGVEPFYIFFHLGEDLY